MDSVRYPTGTPYQGPGANYDAQIGYDALVSRLAYGQGPAPLLQPRQRADSEFYGRLLNELANAHSALVKVCAHEETARSACKLLRKELPTELYEVGHRKRPEGWAVIVYNRITMALDPPEWWYPARPNYDLVTVKEAARVLRLSRNRVTTLLREHGVHTVRTGGRNEHLIPRSALVALANRPRQWKTKKAA